MDEIAQHSAWPSDFTTRIFFALEAFTANEYGIRHLGTVMHVTQTKHHRKIFAPSHIAKLRLCPDVQVAWLHFFFLRVGGDQDHPTADVMEIHSGERVLGER